MVGPTTFIRYVANKLRYSAFICRKAYSRGELAHTEFPDAFWKEFLYERLTFLHYDKGEQMLRCSKNDGGTLLVRKIPAANAKRVRVKDLVVLIDPQNKSNLLIRRVAAVEGHEMDSTDEEDEPFILEKGQCWLLTDDTTVKPKEAYDSRTFGPVDMKTIYGRPIYYLQNPDVRGHAFKSRVYNSVRSTREDRAVLEMELDLDEMAKCNKENA